jgi:hypothetical protein
VRVICLRDLYWRGFERECGSLNLRLVAGDRKSREQCHELHR